MAKLYHDTKRSLHFSWEQIYQRHVCGNGLAAFDLRDGDIIDLYPQTQWPANGLVMLEDADGKETIGLAARAYGQVIVYHQGHYRSPEKHGVKLKAWVIGHYRCHHILINRPHLRLVKAIDSCPKKEVCGTKFAGGGRDGTS